MDGISEITESRHPKERPGRGNNLQVLELEGGCSIPQLDPYVSFIVATDLSKQTIPSRRKPAPKTPYIAVPSMYLSATLR